MKDSLKQEMIESTKFEDEKELYSTLETLEKEFAYLDKERIVRWMQGEEFICVPAVYWVIRSFEKVIYMINLVADLLKEDPKSKNRKMFIIMAHRLAILFDIIYGAACDDPDWVFYNPEESEDLLLLLECLDFSMPEDIIGHRENTIKGIEDFHCSIAIAQRGFRKKNIFSQLASSAMWAVYYKIKKHKIWDHGSFMMAVLDKDAVIRVLKLVQSDYIEKKIGFDKSLPKIALHQLILIPFNKPDLITLDNLDNEEKPEIMTSKELDLPFVKTYEGYDKTTHVQVRVLSDHDWNRVDWEESKLQQDDQECVLADTAIIHVHGGGFIAGSSASSQLNTRPWASETKAPVFSVDYRLSPDYVFPDAVNDWWQFYWWLVNYSEKYLKIKFQRIVLIGDSAGGNLIIAITTLAIQKGVRIPDGLNLIYPAIALSKTAFSPSALLCLDDVFLSSTFLSICSGFYTTDEVSMKKPKILSPSVIPDDILAMFPPCRFTIAGHDPLRDDWIKFMLRLKKQKVNVKGIEFKALMHAFLSHKDKPFQLIEAQKAWDQILDYLIELVKV